MSNVTSIADDQPERTPLERARNTIGTADAKLESLADLLWLLVDKDGQEGGHWAAIAYAIEDAQADLSRAQEILLEARR
jgi:hypothetical protein